MGRSTTGGRPSRARSLTSADVSPQIREIYVGAFGIWGAACIIGRRKRRTGMDLYSVRFPVSGVTRMVRLSVKLTGVF